MLPVARGTSRLAFGVDPWMPLREGPQVQDSVQSSKLSLPKQSYCNLKGTHLWDPSGSLMTEMCPVEF